MEQFIGCDAHKMFSVFVAVNEKGNAGEAVRVAHDRQIYREFLAQLPPQSTIAVEASGHYNWLVDEMERLGHHPKLANPLEAKRRMGLTNKTDRLDARGLAILLRNDSAGSVDPAKRAARSTRAGAYAHFSSASKDPRQEPNPRYPGPSQRGGTRR